MSEMVEFWAVFVSSVIAMLAGAISQWETRRPRVLAIMGIGLIVAIGCYAAVRLVGA